MIILDTGVIVSAVITNDDDHDRCNELMLLLHGTGQELIVPATVAAEVGYMLATRVGADKEAEFLDSLADGTLTLAHLDEYHMERAAELVRQYADLKGKGLGTTDATVVAVAERLRIDTIATLDGHFRAVRPKHINALRLLPDDL